MVIVVLEHISSILPEWSFCGGCHHEVWYSSGKICWQTSSRWSAVYSLYFFTGFNFFIYIFSIPRFCFSVDFITSFSLCVCSQVGCKMGCRFCATGTMGYKSNLTSGEIVEQLVHASRFSQIRNVVFMVIRPPSHLSEFLLW